MVKYKIFDKILIYKLRLFSFISRYLGSVRSYFNSYFIFIFIKVQFSSPSINSNVAGIKIIVYDSPLVSRGHGQHMAIHLLHLLQSSIDRWFVSHLNNNDRFIFWVIRFFQKCLGIGTQSIYLYKSTILQYYNKCQRFAVNL